MKNWEIFLRKYFSTNSLQAILFVLNLSTISLKTLSFDFESMSHSVCLIQGRGSFMEAEGKIFIENK